MKTKHILTIMTLGIFLLGFTFESYAQKSEVVTFKTTLSCGSCAGTITKNLTGAPGVEDFKVDIPTREVWVKYDSGKTNKAKLIQTIGYNACEGGVEVTFSVSVCCGGCLAGIETKLAETEGVVSYKTNLDAKEVWVKYDSAKISKKTLIETIGKSAEEKK
jgi:Cu+-exporting ATPase